METSNFLSHLLTSILFIVTITVYFVLRRNPRVKNHLKKFGGPKTIPGLGNALQLMVPHSQLLGTLGSWFEEFGTTYSMWAGSIVPYVVTCDVNVIEKVISGTAYLDKGKHDYSLFLQWLGTGLLTAPGDKWSGRRKLLTPSFHFKILEDFVPIFNENASILLECLERDGCVNGQTFNMFPYITKCTLDIICETAMGKKMNTQINGAKNNEYADAVNGLCAIIIYKNLRPWFRIPFIYKLTSTSRQEQKFLKIIKGFTLQVIRDRKAEREFIQNEADESHSVRVSSKEETEGIYGKRRKAFLDLLLDVANETQGLTDEDIREEVDTFMFEGHDTTAVGLAWTILLLAMHPKCQQLVHEELDEIFSDNPTRDVTTDDISKMKYLECCVKESLRLMPSVPFIMRQMNTDLKLDDGRIIPKDSTVMMLIYFVHRQSEHFKEAKLFQPERWSTNITLQTKRHVYSYIPFSAGPRNCIGQKFALIEEKIVLAKLLRKYTIDTKETLETLIPIPDVVLRSGNGVQVSLRQR